MNLTLAITVYNRYEMLLESFAGVIDDHRIDEILIMDDHSEDKYWNKIKELPKFNPKIKVVRQQENRGMSENKQTAIQVSKSQWVIIGDSDNIFNKDYVDAIPEVKNETTIFCPSFAKPHFDYRGYENKFIDLVFFKKHINEPAFNCFMNTCNYVVNKEQYLKVWYKNDTVKQADTTWFNYLWLKARNGFFICPGMHYQHRVHAGSGFLENAAYNMAKAQEIKKLIMAL